VRAALLAALVLALAAAGDSAAGGSAKAPAVPRFKHVVVVVFENKESTQVLGTSGAPTFALLARRYALLANYRGVSHPSLPNYLALVSGSTHLSVPGVSEDCTDCQVDGRSLADTLEAAGRTWKTYAEGLPQPGWTGGDAGVYAKKHNPFLYFKDVLAAPSRLARVVPYEQLARDVAANRLPSFALVVPNLCNDMHNCPVSTGDTWLRQNIVPLLSRPALRGSVVFVVFDEGSSSVGGGGHVVALALGPLVRRGVVDRRSLNHYSLLRTIEDAWGLPRLGLSRRAAPITGIWRK
jgi:hypothetical protein